MDKGHGRGCCLGPGGESPKQTQPGVGEGEREIERPSRHLYRIQETGWLNTRILKMRTLIPRSRKGMANVTVGQLGSRPRSVPLSRLLYQNSIGQVAYRKFTSHSSGGWEGASSFSAW